jgi:putative membrane protein
MMRWFYGNGWGNPWGGLLMGLPMIVIWVAIIIGIIYFIKSVSRNGGGFNRSKTPLEILKERYAKGEINDDDYERMKNKLD